MRFDPVEAAHHYRDVPNGDNFDPLKAQETAAASDTLPSDVAGEIDKLRQADRLIFHFPLWWFAPPAILKGWFDRVLAHGALHTVENRFDAGLCIGKKALFCVTTGATAEECAFNGKEADISMLLWPSAYTLRYLGVTVLDHCLVHGVHGYHLGRDKIDLEDRLSKILEDHADVIDGFDQRPALSFNPDRDFDDDGRLKETSPSFTPFIRHKP
jgi:NAD(P)H dehydrogenase (quinone)